MHYKKWLYSGIIIFVLCALIGIVGTVWGISDSFDALRTSEGAAGIDEVGGGIRNAFYFTAFSLIGTLAGSILIVVGGVKAYRQSKRGANS